LSNAIGGRTKEGTGLNGGKVSADQIGGTLSSHKRSAKKTQGDVKKRFGWRAVEKPRWKGRGGSPFQSGKGKSEVE